MATITITASLLLLLLATLSSRSFGFSAGQIIVKPGSSTVQPGSCTDDLVGTKEGNFYQITPGCSPYFYKYCARDRAGNGLYANVSYAPNCIGFASEADTTLTFEILDSIIIAYTRQKGRDRCIDLLVPYLCSSFYPLPYGVKIVNGKVGPSDFFTPCQDYCEDVFEVCDELFDAVTSFLPIKNCSQMCDYPKKNSQQNENSMTNNTNNNDQLPQCIQSPLSPPQCFEACPTNGIANCTKKESKCDTKQVRTSVSKRKFPQRNYQFSAEVKVLEEVHLCKPVNSIAYKVEIIRDFFLDCKICGQYCRELPSGTEVYVLSTDSIDNCGKRCVQPKIEIGKKYLMGGTYYNSKECTEKCNTKIWVLDSVKTASSLLYPWDKYVSKKNKNLFETASYFYRCRAPCKRSSFSYSYYH